jgi:hypothetical protein
MKFVRGVFEVNILFLRIEKYEIFGGLSRLGNSARQWLYLYYEYIRI